jgi:glycosyltransferase involved in cell wall biosynthesis
MAMPGSTKRALVSVIIPLFNAEPYVRDAVRSILDQTLEDLELIVVDDGSTDRGRAIVESHDDPRLIVLVQHNCGYAAAMNLGLSRARGRYVARMDADDLSERERLEKQVTCLDRHGEYVFVGTQASYITPNGRIGGRQCEDLEREGAWAVETWDAVMEGTRKFSDPSVVFRRSQAAAVGGYRTYQRTGQDVDLWLRLLDRGGQAATLHERLYIQRLHAARISAGTPAYALNRVPRILALERRETGADTVMRGGRVEDFVTEDLLKEATVRQAALSWGSAVKCFRVGDFRAGVSFTVDALRREPWTVRNVRRLAGTARVALRGLVQRPDGRGD